MVVLGYTECDLVSIVRLLPVRELGVVRTIVCAVELNTTIQRTFSRSNRVCLYQNVSILEFTGAGYNGGGDVVTTGAVRRAKLQSNRHHQQTNIQLFTGQKPFLSPNQQCWRTEENSSYQLSIAET